MTLLTDLQHKQILVLGAGITGMSCARYLSAQGLCFAVNDSRENPFSQAYSQAYNKEQFVEDFPSASLYLGQWQTELIARADVILISPGIDIVKDNIAQHISKDCCVMGDVELFCQLNNDLAKPIDIIALTGSNGKSTVVSLLAYLAESLGVNAKLGGNIGQPVLDLFTDPRNLPDLLILELSSFQLETLTSMQAIATSVLNVSDDHLDRHLSMDNYQKIKQGIYKQGKLAITNRDDSATNTLDIAQTTVSFGSDSPQAQHFGIIHHESKAYLAFGSQKLIALDQLPLAGMHNALNYLTALAFGYSAGWSINAMIKKLVGFTGLAHRCQRIPTEDGITWINDSKATNIGATLAAINGLAQIFSTHSLSTPTHSTQSETKPRLILIAGGDGKGADFTPLIQPLAQYVSHVITFGKDGDKIAELVTEKNNLSKVSNLQEAVQAAKANAYQGDIVLLSPACASLDMFKNFVDRGEQFMAAVTQQAGVS